MNFDQYEAPRPEQVELARAVTVLLSAIIAKEYHSVRLFLLYDVFPYGSSVYIT